MQIAGASLLIFTLHRVDRMLTKLVSLSLGCSLLCASYLAAYAEPANIESNVNCFVLYGNNVCDLSIKFTGEIVAMSTKRIQSILDASKERTNWLHKQLDIDSPGGNVDASMVIGRLLRENRVSVLVPKGGQCASACVLIFAGAVTRSAFGKIGIHRPYLNQALNSQIVSPEKVKSDYGDMLSGMRAYLREMNVSEGLADDMLKVAPAEMRYLAYDELNNYGLSYSDPVEQEAIDLQDARSLGLDRSEYVRRQAIQKRKCGTLGFDERLACEERVMKSGG
jgi:membrane-bound ClpP family serine protease